MEKGEMHFSDGLGAFKHIGKLVSQPEASFANNTASDPNTIRLAVDGRIRQSLRRIGEFHGSKLRKLLLR
jgi:hypothetical protein